MDRTTLYFLIAGTFLLLGLTVVRLEVFHNSSSSSRSISTNDILVNCAEAIQSHLQVHSDKPKYDLPNNFCSRIPADLSPSYLWNEHVNLVWTASGGDGGGEWMRDLIQFLTPQYLRLGHKARPKHFQFGRVLQILHDKLQDPAQNALQVVVFGGNAAQENEKACQMPRGFEQEPVSTPCSWPKQLQSFLNAIFGEGVVQVTTWILPDTTSELATSILQYRMLPQTPDVIINAYSSNDMYLPQRGQNVTGTVDYYYARRKMTQDFMRAALLCHNQRPLVIHLDDYLGNHHNDLAAETYNARILQQLSDWYGLHLISYANAVRRLVYANTEETVLSPDWSTHNIEYGKTTHTAILWTMAFSFLSATVEYCSHEVMRTDDHPYVADEVIDLIDNVPPPELNTDLLLSTVSEKWRDERNSTECKTSTCSMAFAKGITQDLETYLKPFVVERRGWHVENQGDGQVLVATEPMASLTLRADNVQTLRLFATLETTPDDSQILWQVGNHVKYVNGTHDSDTRIARPYEIHLRNGNHTADPSTIETKIELRSGSRFEIVAMMMCHE